MLYMILSLQFALFVSYIVTFLYLKKEVKQLLLKHHKDDYQSPDIHSMLNDRLVDLQNRRYSISRKSKGSYHYEP